MKSTRPLWIALAVLFVLHNDLWLWEDARLVLGLPIGLLYHVGFCVVAAVLLTLLVRASPLLNAPDDEPAADAKDLST